MAGTDTEVGKTFVACGLAGCLTALGRRVIAVKPVESGTLVLAPEERDGHRLALATGQSTPREALQSLGLPVAPPLAAAREGVELVLEEWVSEIDRLGSGAEWVLVEGAGGLLSPLTAEQDTGDLAVQLGADVLLVAADRLGTLNHALLTVEALARRGLVLRAIVLSEPEHADASTGTNATALRDRVTAPVYELPRCDWEDSKDHLGGLAEQLTSRRHSLPESNDGPLVKAE